MVVLAQPAGDSMQSDEIAWGDHPSWSGEEPDELGIGGGIVDDAKCRNEIDNDRLVEEPTEPDHVARHAASFERGTKRGHRS